MTKISGQGTALFGAGWVEASCNNASGCITIGWNPDGDGNKGNGWNFTSTCVDREADLICSTTVDLANPSTLLGYDGLTIGCSEAILLPVPPPFLLGCANGSTGNTQRLSTPYFLSLIHI